MQPAARPTAGAEQDVCIIPGSARSSVHEPADWEPGQAVTNLGWPRSMLLQVEMDVKGTSNQRACTYSCSDFFKQCFSNQFWLGLINNKKYDTGVLKQPWSPLAGLALVLSILRPMGYGSESETHRGVLEEQLTVPVAHI